MELIKQCTALAAVMWVLGASGSTSVAGDGGGAFYRGKTLTLVQGAGDPGGTADLRTKPVVQYLQRSLKGNPSFVFQYMSGGGGVAAGNYMAQVAKRDGLTVGVLPSSVFGHARLGTPAVRYNLNDFIFLGSPTSGGPYTIAIRSELGLDTVEKLKAYRGVRFADRSVGHTMYNIGRVMSFVLDLAEPRWVLGYNSAELRPALERGEADARANNLSSILRETPHWLKEGFHFPVVMRGTVGHGAEAVPDFPQDRPTVERYADTELKRAVLRFHNAIRPAGTVFMVPKGIPEAALKDLQAAFNKIWSDPQFARDYERLTGDDAQPVSGASIEKSLNDVPEDSAVMAVYKQLTGPGPLPPSK